MNTPHQQQSLLLTCRQAENDAWHSLSPAEQAEATNNPARFPITELYGTCPPSCSCRGVR